MDGFPSQAFLGAMDPKAHIQACADALKQHKLVDIALQADMLDKIKAFLRTQSNLPTCSEESKAEAETLIQALTSWANALRGPVKAQKLSRQSTYSIKQLWHAFMSSRFIRGATFRNALEHACGTHWPDLMSAVIGEATGPSRSTMRRSQILVDMALLLAGQRRNARKGTGVTTLRWGWSDASPQGGREWLISKHISISAQALLPCFFASTLLALDCPTSAASAPMPVSRQCPSSEVAHEDLQFDGEAEEGASHEAFGRGSWRLKQGLTKSERQALVKYLKAHMELHCHIPTSLGSGAAALQNKAAALVHSIGVECASPGDMQGYLHGVMSWTSDLGPESLLPGFNIISPTDLLPPWWEWSGEQADSIGIGARAPVHHLVPERISKTGLMSSLSIMWCSVIAV